MNNIDWKNATPEQKLLWRHASGLIAYNTVTPLVYFGTIAGSEFLTYAATKLYICLEFDAYVAQASLITNSGILFYDVANAVCAQIDNKSVTYNTTSSLLNYYTNFVKTTNIYFSRIVTNVVYTNMKFIGYRLTIV